MEERKLRFVSMRFEHHAGHSGYDLVAGFNCPGHKTCTIRVPEMGGLGGYYEKGNRMRHRIVRNISDRAAYRYTEARAGARLLGDKGAIYHVLYGEVTHRYLGVLTDQGQP